MRWDVLTGKVEVAELCSVAEAWSEPWTGQVIKAHIEDGQWVKVLQNKIRQHSEVVGVDVDQLQLPVSGENTDWKRRQVVATEPKYLTCNK